MPRTKRPKKADLPLRCHIKDGKLVFEIGVDTLAFAALESQFVYDMSHEYGVRQETYHITDNKGFAVDVVRAINDEAEDGSTILTDMLDKAIQEAIEDGAEHFISEKELEEEKSRKKGKKK